MFMKHNMENESPHWRGRLWLTINYLVLSALDYYSKGMWWNATTKVVTCGRVMTTAIMEKGQRAFTHLQAQQLS
jgi:hypothetical protein